MHLLIEKAFFGGDQRAVAVDVDRAAFQNEFFYADHRAEHRHFQNSRCFFRDSGVFSPIAVFCPGIEFETDDRHLPRLSVVFHENRTGIARPSAIGGKFEELHARRIHTHAFEHATRARFMLFRIHQDANCFAFGEMADNFTVDPVNRLDFTGPVGGIVRPADPGGLVRFPFGGHVESAGRGSFCCD